MVGRREKPWGVCWFRCLPCCWAFSTWQGARPPVTPSGLSLSVWATPPTGRSTLRTDWWGQRCREAGCVTSRSRRGVGGGTRQWLNFRSSDSDRDQVSESPERGSGRSVQQTTVSSNSDVRRWLLVEQEEQIRSPGPALPFPSCVTHVPAEGVRQPLSPCDLTPFRFAERERKAAPAPWPCHSFQEHLQELPWQQDHSPALLCPGLLAPRCLLTTVLQIVGARRSPNKG